MPLQITLSSGTTFLCNEKQTILEAAEAAGLRLPYSCKNGTCSSCKCTVASGSWLQPEGGALKSQERETIGNPNGVMLTCTAVPLSDMLINIRELLTLKGIQVHKMIARIQSIELVTDTVAIITLDLSTTSGFVYKAGQYLEILMRDGRRRSYSIASAPHTNQLVFHIRKQPQGMMSELVFPSDNPMSQITTWKEKDILRLEGPFGTFCLNEASDRPIIFVVSGTGFAPIYAMMEHMLYQQKTERPITLYWGVNRPKDLYDHESCRRWAQQFKHFTFVPVVSDALVEDEWLGRRGLVHHAVMADFPLLQDYEVYACGAPIMVSSARTDFIKQRGLIESNFYADSFEFAAPQVPLSMTG